MNGFQRASTTKCGDVCQELAHWCTLQSWASKTLSASLEPWLFRLLAEKVLAASLMSIHGCLEYGEH
eukprot:4445243-Amphidinium_carterae.2